MVSNTLARIAERILQVQILWEFTYVTSMVCLREMVLSSIFGVEYDFFHALKAHAHVFSFGLGILRQ